MLLSPIHVSLSSMTRPRNTGRTGRAGRGAFEAAAAWPASEPARRSLTRGEIVAQALDLLDAEGFDGLSMRRLADRLGIKAASLYNHVKDKQELLGLMADAISAEIPDVNPAASWRRELERMAGNVRRVLLQRRDGARVLAATFPAGPNRLRLIEQLLATLRRAGFTRAAVADLTYILNSYVVGFVLDETSGRPAGRTDAADARRMREAGRAWFKSLPADRYPTIVSLADELVDAPADRRFTIGLRALLDGFASKRVRR